MDLITAINAKRDEIVRAQEKLQELLRTRGEEFLSDGLKPFWDKYPQIRTIHWTQYTPYFNDGDECVFGVGDIYFSDKKADDLSGTYNDETGDEEDIFSSKWNDEEKRFVDPDGITEEMKADSRAVANMIEALDLKLMFGDHRYIRLTRGGVMVEDYEHD